MSDKWLRIRFNTEHNGNLKWRVVYEDWKEELVDIVRIYVDEVMTTEDTLPNGKVKHHIGMAYNKVRFSEKNGVRTCIVT